jgi:hypothetical protein
LGNWHFCQRGVGGMRVLLLISIVMLGACAKQPALTLPTAWARADGRPVNSALLDIDSLDCKDEIQKPEGAIRDKADKDSSNHAIVEDFVGCMRARGYVQTKG